MGMLTNQRHELFAQAVAAGKTQDEAYAEAGYSPNRHNASRLMNTDETIRARVEELQARAPKGLVITRQWVIEELVDTARMGKAAGDLSARNRAVELLGKDLGMFVEKSEIDQKIRVISDQPQTPDEWENEFAPRLEPPARRIEDRSNGA